MPTRKLAQKARQRHCRQPPNRIETDENTVCRKSFVRTIGYKGQRVVARGQDAPNSESLETERIYSHFLRLK